MSSCGHGGSTVDSKKVTSPAALSSLDAALARLPRPLLVALGLAGVALIAVLDAASHHSLPLVAFYVAPVLAVAWLSRSLACGLVVAVAAVLVRPCETLCLAAPPGVPSASPALLAAGAAAQLALYLVLLALLGSLRRYLESREAEALRDALTGVANQRGFLATAEAELERSRRYHHQLSLLYLDVDDFKAANDRLGHAEGNRLLSRLGAVLTANLRAIDTPARLGGDEFAVLMPETKSRAAAQLAERLMAALREECASDGTPLSCSAGLVTYRTPPASVEALLAASDQLMYEAKAGGKNQLRRALLPLVRTAPPKGRRGA
jgi:diguanylate cyclase (GGDEF)-like protein